MFIRYLATALALSIILLLPAGAGAAGTSFAPLTRSVSASHLGKHPAADLRRGVHRARVQYRGRRYCASLKTLGDVVDRAGKLRGGARVERAARSLQRTVFLKHAAHRGRCGLAPPRFRVGSVKPDVGRLPSLADGHPRVVARLAGAHGMTTDFVQDELVVEGPRATAARLAGRWHGKVLGSSSIRNGQGETHLIRIDARRAPTADLAADLIDIDPRARGAFKVSSPEGLGLVAVAADAAAHGLKVAPNLLSEGAGVLDRSTREGTVPPSKPGDPPSTLNAFGWWYTTSLGTGDAWRALAIGGKTSNRVKLAVLDGGFSSAGLVDLSPASTGFDDVRNRMKCTGGNDCPWHGTEVASAAAGVIDNGLGAFGSGGQVADVAMFHNDGALFSALGAVYDAVDSGARIINISSGYELDATVSFFSVPYEDATQTAFERGTLVVASAGNDGRDVDAEDCFVVCWEEEWVAPCENDPVICVGGIKPDGKRDELSNYGRESCATAQDCDVDIFGPMNVWVGPTGDNANPHRRNGTSFSSPYVAGVLAMIMAAHPNISPADAKQALLDSADRGADETVSRIVNGLGAVTRVAGRLGPLVEIGQADPKPLYGGFNTTTLKATVSSVGPCKCTIEWTSDKDGAMGTGASIDYVYPTPGERTVTVTVKDANGATATDKVKVEAMNERPSARITKPSDGAHVYSGQPFKLEGHADDPNEPGGLSCDALWWSVPGKPAMAGCSPTMTLDGDNATTWVTLKATDAHGAWTSYTVTLHVDKPPTHSPPLVTILEPSEGELLEPGDAVTLEGTATDPDAGSVTGTWSVKVGGTTKVIGQGNTLQWKPSNHVPQGCGNVAATLIFSATDSDGTSSDQVGIKVHYPVC